MPGGRQDFDPRVLLSALERSYVNCVVIGGLARVIRGSGEITHDLDVCPSLSKDNIPRLQSALAELNASRDDGHGLALADDGLGDELVELATNAGRLTLVPSPAGAPSGFLDLRRAATNEHLGHGLRPLVASTGDLARLAAALHRDQDIARLPQLRRVMELEANRELILSPETRGPSSAAIRRLRKDRERLEQSRRLGR
jgi:hypothetical protein